MFKLSESQFGFYVESIELFVKMSAIDYLTKAVEYDMNGRKLESLKLYQQGISALLEICKSKNNIQKFKIEQTYEIHFGFSGENEIVTSKAEGQILEIYYTLYFLNWANKQSIN